MKEKNLIIICLAAVLCIGAISATVLFTNQNNTNDSANDTINISLNDSQNNTTENTTTTKKTTTAAKSSENKEDKEEKSEYGDYINDEWVSMSEEEYANRYPALYHEQSLSEGKYDQYHPEFYEVDRENGRI